MSQPYTCLTHPKKDLREEIVKDEFLGRTLWYIIFNRDFRTNEIKLTERNLARDLSKPRKKVSPSTARRIILSLIEMRILESVKKSSNRSDTSVYKLSPHFEMWSKFLSFDEAVSEADSEAISEAIVDQKIEGERQRQKAVSEANREAVSEAPSIINNNINTSKIPPLYFPPGKTSFSDSPEQKAIPKNKKTKTRTSRKRKQSQKPKITKVIYGMQTQEIQLCLHLINLKGPTSRFPCKGIEAPKERLLALQNWAVDFHEILKLYDFGTIKAMLEFAFSENRQGHVVQAPSKLLAKLKDENNSFLDLFSLSQKPENKDRPDLTEKRKMDYSLFLDLEQKQNLEWELGNYEQSRIYSWNQKRTDAENLAKVQS